MNKEGKCSICGGNYSRYGNNAEPVNDGRCCTDCDLRVVVPARLVQMGYSPEQAKAIGEGLAMSGHFQTDEAKR